MNPLLIPVLTTLLVSASTPPLVQDGGDLISVTLVTAHSAPDAMTARTEIAAARGVDATTGKPLPYCFRDKNDDNKCDKSVNAGGKCPRNCVRASTPPATPPPQQAGTGCAGCGACQLG